MVFNDVEVLTQESPDKSGSPRKRSYEEFRGISARIADLQERCGTGRLGRSAAGSGGSPVILPVSRQAGGSPVVLA